MPKRRLATGTAIIVGVWAIAGGIVFAEREDDDGAADSFVAGVPNAVARTGPTTQVLPPIESRFAVVPAAGGGPLDLQLGRPPSAGLLFDVDSGEVLWQRHPRRRLPIASLTKMMTALVIAERHGPRERVLITQRATNFAGSGVGVLPAGKRVALESLMKGLMLVSGNDTAIALAQHDAGSLSRFVARMNRRARQLGLSCTRFSTPSGILDEGNWSCTYDLAALARADLANPRVRRIVATPQARFRFPVKGGFLDLSNINPFLEAGIPRITGVKTGLTTAAGRCYVITARRGGRHLGVVLLDSPDPLVQVPRLLDAGFRSLGIPSRILAQSGFAPMPEPEPARSG